MNHECKMTDPACRTKSKWFAAYDAFSQATLYGPFKTRTEAIEFLSDIEGKPLKAARNGEIDGEHLVDRCSFLVLLGYKSQ